MLALPPFNGHWQTMSRQRKFLNLIFASILAATAGFSLFQLSFARAMGSVVASAPMPVEAQIVDWQRCALDMIGERRADTSRCKSELYAARTRMQSFLTNPLPESTRESGGGMIWFLLAGLSFPLSFGSAGLLGFFLFRD